MALYRISCQKHGFQPKNVAGLSLVPDLRRVILSAQPEKTAQRMEIAEPMPLSRPRTTRTSSEHKVTRYCCVMSQSMPA